MGPRLKKFYQALVTYQTIALDTSCFIYHIELKPKYIELARIIFEELLPAGKVKTISSILIITEILTKPYALNRSDLAIDYKDLILGFPNLTLFTPDAQICNHAALLRAKYNLHTPDAIHIATAIDQNASAILTNDAKWKRIREIAVLVLDDYC